jgi:hypothetical protein
MIVGIKTKLYGVLAASCGLVISMTLGASPASAQVTVLARGPGGAAAVVVSSNAPDTWNRAVGEANRRGGGYYTLLQSDITGYGAVQCYTAANGVPVYFLVQGYSNPGDADRQAFANAQRIAPRGVSIALCGNWNNQNRHPLQRGN